MNEPTDARRTDAQRKVRRLLAMLDAPAKPTDSPLLREGIGRKAAALIERHDLRLLDGEL